MTRSLGDPLASAITPQSAGVALPDIFTGSLTFYDPETGETTLNYAGILFENLPFLYSADLAVGEVLVAKVGVGNSLVILGPLYYPDV